MQVKYQIWNMLKTVKCSWIAPGRRCLERFVEKDGEALVAVSVCPDRLVMSVRGPELGNGSVYLLNSLNTVLQKCKPAWFFLLLRRLFLWIYSDDIRVARQLPLWAWSYWSRCQRLKWVPMTRLPLRPATLQERLEGPLSFHQLLHWAWVCVIFFSGFTAFHKD